MKEEIHEALAAFGLSENEQAVYLTLLKHGWSTALELSRQSRVKRSTLYRVLEGLQDRGLVVVQLDDKTTHYNAADPKQFETLVSEQAKKAETLRETNDLMQPLLGSLSRMEANETGVRFYRGVRGLQHMEWRMCEVGNKEVLVFGSSQWHVVLGEEFAEEIRAEMVRKGILVREIVNLEKTKRPVVNQDGTATWTVNGEFLKKHFQYKVVSERMVNISQDIYLVGTNVIQLRGYRDGDIFGVEIESRDFTMMLKQLFEVVWGMGEEATR